MNAVALRVERGLRTPLLRLVERWSANMRSAGAPAAASATTAEHADDLLELITVPPPEGRLLMKALYGLGIEVVGHPCVRPGVSKSFRIAVRRDQLAEARALLSSLR